LIKLVLSQIAHYIEKLAAPVSPSTKAGVAIGTVFLLAYVATFHTETPLERFVLLTSTITSLVAGYALGAKS
jgi:hypothetical protein